jgi:hypothetical protein
VLTLAPADQLVAARVDLAPAEPPPFVSWSVVARFQADGQPDAAELRGALDELWRARHHHPSLWCATLDGWRPLASAGAVSVPRLKLTWDLSRAAAQPPSAVDLAGRMGALERALQALAPCELHPSHPVAVAVERGRALARLRRAWGEAQLLRLVGGPRGIDAAGCWFYLRDLGFQAGDDGWLHYGTGQPGHPSAISAGTSGPPRRLEPALMTMGDLHLSDLVLRYQPALAPRPRLLAEAVLGLARGLAEALSVEVRDGSLEPLQPERLVAQAELVEAGLRSHGLTPGNSATVWLFARDPV